MYAIVDADILCQRNWDRLDYYFKNIADESTNFEQIWPHMVGPFGEVDNLGDASRENFNKF